MASVTLEVHTVKCGPQSFLPNSVLSALREAVGQTLQPLHFQNRGRDPSLTASAGEGSPLPEDRPAAGSRGPSVFSPGGL